MKQPVKSPTLQLNLQLVSTPAMVIPDRQKDLKLALVELLMTAADQSAGPQGNGGGDESETHG